MSISSEKAGVSRLGVEAAVSSAMILLSSCSVVVKSSDQCWSTDVLRAQVGTTVYDLPAAMHPAPDPSRTGGMFYPHYKVGDPPTRPRLLWCQDKSHVPVHVRSFSLDLSERGDAKPIELLRISRLNQSLPDERTSDSWKIRSAGQSSTDATLYDISDLRGRHAPLWCQHFAPLRTSKETALCRMNLAAGDDAALFIAFNGDGLSPPQYLEVIQSAERLIAKLHMKREQPMRL